MMRRPLGLMLGLAVLIGPTIEATAEEHPKPSAELCSIYRQGPVVHRRMAVYYGAPSTDPNSFYWIDVWFRPEYLFDPALEGLQDPGGLPEHDLLFDLDVLTGQPLPLDYRRSARPQDASFFTLLLSGGRNHISSSRIISVLGATDLNRDWKRTGEFLYSFEKVEIIGPVDPQVGKPRDDVFVAPTSGGDVAVMACSPKGFDLVPHCQVYDKSSIFSMQLIGIRMNQLDKIEVIRKHAADFAACLTWKGND